MCFPHFYHLQGLVAAQAESLWSVMGSKNLLKEFVLLAPCLAPLLAFNTR